MLVWTSSGAAPRVAPEAVSWSAAVPGGVRLVAQGTRVLAAAVLLAAASTVAAAAQPGVKSSVAGFADVNGNGVLDCGEPVDLIATFSTRNSGTPDLNGSLFVPAGGSSGLAFVHGSVRIDPDLTTGCTGTVVAGNGPIDTDARIDFFCPADPPDNNAWTLVVRYQAVYQSSGAASFTAAALATASTGATYQDSVTAAAGSVCGGVPAQIAVTKTAAGPATPGSVLVYTVTASDQSGAGAGGVQLVDTVPAHGTFSAAGSSPGWVCSPNGAAGSVCRNPVGNLDPNGSLSRAFAIVLDGVFPAAPFAVANTACARLGPSVVAGCGSVTTAAGGTPVLKLAKTVGSGTAVPGATLAYTLTAANTGNQDLADAVLQESVPAHTTFAAAASSAGWVCAGAPAAGVAGSACTLDVGALSAGGAGGAAVSRTFAVKVDDPLPALPPDDAIGNTACLHTAAAGVADACSSVAVPSGGVPMLKAVKSVKSGSGRPGDTLVYDLAVQNTGDEGAGVVTAAETVPAHTSFAAGASTAGWVCAASAAGVAGAAGAACTLNMGTLAAGATAHVLFAVTVDKPLAAGVASIGNTACFSSAQVAEGRPAGRGRRGGAERAGLMAGGVAACDTVTVPAAGHVALEVTKTYAGAAVTAGAVLGFQIGVANSGDQDAAGVTVTETVPAHSSFVAAGSSPGWACAPNGAAGAGCSLGLGTVAGGAAAVVVFAVRADSPLPADVTAIGNTACAAAAGLAGLAGSAAVCGEASTPPAGGAPAVTAELSYAFGRDVLGSGLAVAGDDLVYSLTVRNGGSAAVVGLVVTVPLDAHLALDVGSVTTTAGTVTAGNGETGAGDGVPAVAVASLAAGASVTVRFTAAVTGPLPAGLKLLSSQATVRGENVPATVSDDPATPEPLDPTTTPVASGAAPPAARAIPALGTWGLVALAVGLGGVSVGRLRRPRLGPREKSVGVGSAR